MPKPSAPFSHVRQLIADAKLQTGFIANVPPGFVEATSYMSKPAAVSSVLGLNSEKLPSLIAVDGQHLTHAPFAPTGAATMTIAAAIAATSRVVQCGSHLIVRGEQDKPMPTGATGVVAMHRAIGAFSTIEAAPFATVPDDADVSVSDFPVARAALDWSQSISKGVRFEIPRSMQKTVGEDQLANELLLAVALGIARAADEVLLAEINAATPSAFSLAAAAARGLKHGELHALIGTSATGAAIAQDGALRAAGVTGEFTPDMTGTLIGSFARSAVAIHPDVQLTIERKDTKGNLVATAWIQLIPLVPDATAFWAAA